MFSLILLAAASAPAQMPYGPPPEIRPRLRIQLDLQRRVPGHYDACPPPRMRYEGGGPRTYVNEMPPPPPGGRWETIESWTGETYLVPSFPRGDFAGNGNGGGYGNGYRGGNGNGGSYGVERSLRGHQGGIEYYERPAGPTRGLGGPPVREYRGR